jgi:Na+/H+ antiporter NhaC
VSASLTVAVILLLIGMLTVCLALYSIRPYPAMLAGALTAVAVPIFIGFLSIQYALVAIAQEGVSPTDESYRVIGLLAHAAADWGGWTGIVLLCASLLTIGAAMLRYGFNRLVAYSPGCMPPPPD